MEYRGYHARVDLDEEAEVFHGRVVDIGDVVNFQAESFAQLKVAFQESVDEYLAFCEERGRDPERPYSGKFVLRIEPELHHLVHVQAEKSQKSINSWIEETLRDAVAKSTEKKARIA